MRAFVKGYEIQIDHDELWRLQEHSYCVHKRKTHFYIRRGGNPPYYLHREIMDTPKGMVCDHINGDTFDCRKKNLRNCTDFENYKNYPKPITNKSGYKGVHCDNRLKKNKWIAQISINNHNTYIGSFSTPELAYKAYLKESKKYHGCFARKEITRNVLLAPSVPS
jgi:hypothetical protein